MRAKACPLFFLFHRFLFENNIKEYEMGLLANLAPSSVEEATTLVPSLKVRRERNCFVVEIACLEF